MALYALQDVDDAAGVARDFLTPVTLRRWLKLAFIVLFVGGGNSVSTSFNTGGVPNDTVGEVPLPELDRLLPLLATLLVGILLVGLVLGIVSAIMEFVFVESLRSGDVTIRRYWRRRWRQGLRLFGFRILVLLPALVLALALVAPFLLPSFRSFLLLGFVVLLPLLVVVGLLAGLVNGFTTMFVVPIMIQNDCSVLDGWRRLWSSLTANWKQYLAYAVLHLVLTIGLGLAVGIVMTVLALLVLLPLALVGVAAFSVVSLSSPAGLALLAALGGFSSS